jgi:glycosyltransferase involved in cell wall biosynthesis
MRALEGIKRFLGDTPTETKLVFSGISPEGQQELQQHIERLGLGRATVVLGWMAEEELAGLFKYCWALLFPSLHEGFGIPVVEAFQFGKPVLCSNVTSLPEVAGEAALYFDPNSSAAIAAAITRLAENPQLAADLIQKGRSRLASFPNSREIARQYEAVIAEVLDES